jgi:hypothetical protein
MPSSIGRGELKVFETNSSLWLEGDSNFIPIVPGGVTFPGGMTGESPNFFAVPSGTGFQQRIGASVYIKNVHIRILFSRAGDTAVVAWTPPSQVRWSFGHGNRSSYPGEWSDVYNDTGSTVLNTVSFRNPDNSAQYIIEREKFSFVGSTYTNTYPASVDEPVGFQGTDRSIQVQDCFIEYKRPQKVRWSNDTQSEPDYNAPFITFYDSSGDTVATSAVLVFCQIRWRYYDA